MIALLTLYGHWCTADSVRSAILHHGHARRSPDLKMRLSQELYEVAMFHSALMRVQVFYALEYVVIDGYRELGDHAASIDALLTQDYVNNLRRIRNAVFHYQVEPLHPKLRALLEQPESERWINTLHTAFGSYFREKPMISQLLSLIESLNQERDELPPPADPVLPNDRPSDVAERAAYAGPERRLGSRRRFATG